ncbi:MAG TPA: AraC family transcriptional regulator [Dongiaceae bacterium]|nr:AraC family transcriptional regulator [Dongiaceae bacterium]
MTNNNKLDATNLPVPAFQVQWGLGSTQATETIFWEPKQQLTEPQSPSKLRNALASLHTDTTHVEVSDMDWVSPITLQFTPNRVGFSALVSSTSVIRYGYAQENLLRSTAVGNLLFMLPGQEIHAEIEPGRLSTVTCSFDTAYAENIIGPLEQLSHVQLHNALDLRSSLISSILLRLMQEALYPGAISQAVAESFGHAILTECAHWLKAQDDRPPTTGHLTARELQIIEQYLAGLSGKSPSVAELASACGFSERYFAKLFRDQTGFSISQYFKAVQTSKAKVLLQETDLPLKEIAYRLGYSSAANFSSSFRAATGITPGQFRKPD